MDEWESVREERAMKGMEEGSFFDREIMATDPSFMRIGSLDEDRGMSKGIRTGTSPTRIFLKSSQIRSTTRQIPPLQLPVLGDADVDGVGIMRTSSHENDEERPQDAIFRILWLILIPLVDLVSRFMYGESYFDFRQQRSSSYEKKISWHPHVNNFCVAMPGDARLHFYKVSGADGSVVAVQSVSLGSSDDICHIARNPQSANTLAVSLDRFVMIVKLNPQEDAGNYAKRTMEMDSFSLKSRAERLAQLEFSNVHTMSWSADGSLLALGSRNCRSTLVYNCVYKTDLWLSKLPSGVSQVGFSPKGEFLACAGKGYLDIYETRFWTHNRWKIPTSKKGVKAFCNALCWTSDGGYLFVFLENDHFFYVFSVRNKILRTATSFQTNLQNIVFSQKENVRAAFGIESDVTIRQAALDSTDTRLAITFTADLEKSDDGTESKVALYSVSPRVDGSILFNALLLLGIEDTVSSPANIEFKPTIRENDNLLSVITEEGEVHFVAIQ